MEVIDLTIYYYEVYDGENYKRGLFDAFLPAYNSWCWYKASGSDDSSSTAVTII